MFTSDPVLIVGNDSEYCEALGHLVSRYGLPAASCASLSEARTLLDQQSFSAILCEEVLPDGYWGALIPGASGRHGVPPVIIVSDRDDWDSYLALVGIGAFDYVHYPPHTGELERSLWLALSEAKSSHRKAA